MLTLKAKQKSRKWIFLLGGRMNTLIFNDKKYVLVEEEDYRAMIDIVEGHTDTALARGLTERFNDEERIPASVINRLYLDNEPPLRVWREYRGFTGRKLAEAVGISSAYLSDIENGKKNGSVAVIKRIADVLCVDVDDII